MTVTKGTLMSAAYKEGVLKLDISIDQPSAIRFHGAAGEAQIAGDMQPPTVEIRLKPTPRTKKEKVGRANALETNRHKSVKNRDKFYCGQAEDEDDD